MKSNLGEKVANDIRDRILDGTYVPGSKLPNEFELAESYNVCRYTIREAIRKLTAVGLVTVKRGIGTFVNENQVTSYFETAVERLVLSYKSVDEIFETRITIEAKTAELAARNAIQTDIEEMYRIYNKMEKELFDGDFHNFTQLDIDFHTCLARSGRNSILCDILHILYDMITCSMESVPATEEKFKHTMEDHLRIINAIEAKDCYAAASVMTKHLTYCRNLLAETEV